jgi:hypothetical protein
MSSKLDQSLEEIAGTRRNDVRRSRRNDKPRTSTGGVTKNTTAARPAGRQPRTANATAAIVGAALPTVGESKIIVSNLVCQISALLVLTIKHSLIHAAFRCHGADDQGTLTEAGQTNMAVMRDSFFRSYLYRAVFIPSLDMAGAPTHILHLRVMPDPMHSLLASCSLHKLAATRRRN